MVSRYYKLTFNGCWCIYPELFDILSEIEHLMDGMLPGEAKALEIEIVQMTREEFKALPEFTGW